MTNEEIFALMDRFEAGRCVSLKLSTQNATLELSKASAPSVLPAAEAPAAPAVPPRPPEDLFVTAPLVGTYYAAPAPGQAPFVRVGDRVEKGQTLCLLEAMKMMSEVPAACDLVVEELLRTDGDLVGFGDPILRYRAV